VYQNGRVTIQPLQLEIEDDEGDLTDFRQLHDPEAGIAVMERNKEQSTLLHFVAGSELATFLDMPTAPLGLGSFDGIEKNAAQNRLKRWRRRDRLDRRAKLLVKLLNRGERLVVERKLDRLPGFR